jgi:hypothetical protein
LYYILKKQKTPPTGEIELGIHLLTTMIKHQPEKEGFAFFKKGKETRHWASLKQIVAHDKQVRELKSPALKSRHPSQYHLQFFFLWLG